jgi:hypothetical protein
MPIAEPDCEGARERGSKAYRELLTVLHQRYGILLNHKFGVSEESLDKLEKVLQDIFVEDTCNGF